MGGGIQVNGGAAVLRTVMEDGEWKELRGRMNMMEEVVSSTFCGDGGGRQLLRIDIGEAFRGFKFARDLVGNEGGGEGTDSYTVMRAALIEELYGSAERAERTEFVNEKVKGVREEGGKYTVATDGGEKSYDLVVGCDGVSSTVKKFVSPKSIPIYTNVRISWAVTEPSNEDQGNRLEQYFGYGGYGLTGTYGYGEGENCRMAVLVYRDGRRKGKEGTEDEVSTTYHLSIHTFSSSLRSSPFRSLLTPRTLLGTPTLKQPPPQPPSSTGSNPSPSLAPPSPPSLPQPQPSSTLASTSTTLSPPGSRSTPPIPPQPSYYAGTRRTRCRPSWDRGLTRASETQTYSPAQSDVTTLRWRAAWGRVTGTSRR